LERFLNLSQIELAKDYLKQANLRLQTAERVLEKDAFAYSIRQSQEGVELALKAALRLVGIDFPKWHNVGPLLEKEREKFPEVFKQRISKLALISEKLSNLREDAMYGNEQKGKGPSSLFTKADSEEILDEANLCLNEVENLFEKFNKMKS
jgi:HEPN domain-containing protein